MFEDVDFSLSESAKGVKFVISGINWTMCRPGVDDYTISLEKLIASMRDKGIGVSHFKSSAGDTPTTAPCESSQTTQTDNSSIPLKPKSTKPVKVLLGFDSPNGVAVTGEGNIVVADMVTHQLIVYDKDYQKIGTIGGEGVEDGKFFCPQGVTVDHDNNILVTTYTMKCVHKFTVDGEFLGSAGTPGKGDCQFTAPYGLCVSKNTGNVYICDMSNNRIQILSKDLTYLGQFSDTDSEFGSGRLNSPTGIAIDNNGLLYVTDMMNHCIQVFDGEGKFLKRISKQGHLNGCLTAPTAIAIDDDELIHVADGMCRISTFTKFGVFVRSFGSNGAQLGSFTTPRGICYDHLKRMIVTEWSNNRVQIFQ
jgi:DNA-binding beta-propeller fold protein YncE